MPAIMNDVATDTAHPVQFLEQMKGFPKQEYDPRFPEFQKKLYPDIAPLQVGGRGGSAAQLLELCKTAGMKIGANKVVGEELDNENSAFRLQFLFITPLLRFRDDLVVQLTDGTLQCRSKSRVGRSDLGANAKRIRALFAAIQDLLKKAEGN